MTQPTDDSRAAYASRRTQILRQATRLHEAGRTDDALALLDAMPTEVAGWAFHRDLHRADFLREAGRVVEAQRSARSAVRQRPRSDIAQMVLYLAVKRTDGLLAMRLVARHLRRVAGEHATSGSVVIELAASLTDIRLSREEARLTATGRAVRQDRHGRLRAFAAEIVWTGVTACSFEGSTRTAQLLDSDVSEEPVSEHGHSWRFVLANGDALQFVAARATFSIGVRRL